MIILIKKKGQDKMKISTSILNSTNRLECIKKLNQTTTDYIHIDTMDGIFVPDKQQNTLEELNSIIITTKKKLDIHLMVENPNYYIERFNSKKIEYITFHLEINQDISLIINKIKEKGYKVGISLKPQTSIEKIIPYLNQIDLVLIMSVEPGKGGQKFLPSSLHKIKQLTQIIKENNYPTKIEVDGGVKDTNIKTIQESGADIAVIGTYIINSNNYQASINNLINTKKK